MRLILVIATLMSLTLGATAQTSPPAASAATPPASATAPPVSSVPPVDCRAQAQAKGLSGQELRDSVAVCVQEQRLACIKDAVAKKIVGKQRREFMQTCAGRPNRQGKKQDRL
ncbi:MAG TPA: hypothetical protein VFA57_16275 [Pseudolabrys sp.]|nr:hypothetical protein [Pseudolabrys sp.]